MRIPRLGCLGWLLAVAVVLALGVLAFWLWFISTADIRRVEAEARAMGIPPTWAEAGLVQSDQETLERFAALLAIGKRTPSWTENNFERQPRFGEPLPPELIAFQAGVPAATWTDVVELSTELSAHPVVRYATAKDAVNDEAYRLRSVCRLLVERVLVVPLAEIPALANSSTRVALAIQPQTLMDQLVMLSMGSITAAGIAKRLPELRGTAEGRAVAQELRLLRDGLWRTRADGWIGELPLYLESMTRLSPFLDWPLSWDLEQSQKALALDAKAVAEVLARRCRRLEDLRYCLRYIQSTRQAEGLADLIQRGRHMPPPPAMDWVAAHLGLPPGDFPGDFVREGLVRNLLFLEVVAAELDGSPLPPDYFAAAGGPLHPIMRDGARIGWYTVNSDGVDDGGRMGKDFGFATDGTLGRPLLAGPPPARVLTTP